MSNYPPGATFDPRAPYNEKACSTCGQSYTGRRRDHDEWCEGGPPLEVRAGDPKVFDVLWVGVDEATAKQALADGLAERDEMVGRGDADYYDVWIEEVEA